MANPPITIGPFTNVPAPGSPIRSDWPQTISQWVFDHLPKPAGVNGVAGALSGTNQVFIRSDPFARAGTVLVVARFGLVVSTAPCALSIILRTIPGNTQIGSAGEVLTVNGAHNLAITSTVVAAAGAQIELLALITSGAGAADANTSRIETLLVPTA